MKKIVKGKRKEPKRALPPPPDIVFCLCNIDDAEEWIKHNSGSLGLMFGYYCAQKIARGLPMPSADSYDQFCLDAHSYVAFHASQDSSATRH